MRVSRRAIATIGGVCQTASAKEPLDGRMTLELRALCASGYCAVPVPRGQALYCRRCQECYCRDCAQPTPAEPASEAPPVHPDAYTNRRWCPSCASRLGLAPANVADRTDVRRLELWNAVGVRMGLDPATGEPRLTTATALARQLVDERRRLLWRELVRLRGTSTSQRVQWVRANRRRLEELEFTGWLQRCGRDQVAAFVTHVLERP